MKRIPPYKHRRYWCRCDCGRKRVIVDAGNLRSGNTRSCGCVRSYENVKKWANSQRALALREEMRLRHKGKGQRSFWNKVDKNGPMPSSCVGFGNCWLWTGHKNKAGYGRLTVNYKDCQATHIAFLLTTGDLPQGEVMHACDNPTCVNPRHLIDGTSRANAYDRAMKNKGAILIDALTADAVVKPGSTNPGAGTEND